jgi:drug/metabolite transporter (DMT)-like permease
VNESHNPHKQGIAALSLSVLFCAAAHLLLRSGALEFSPALFSNWRLFLGLGIYACGTLLWIYCLSKLDLSVAFPASAVQFVLVLAGARWTLGEQISIYQLIGTAIILVGIALLFFERRKLHA